MNILFLTASTGGGHLKAAEAVKEYIEFKYPGARTWIVDTLKYISPLVDRLIVGGYLGTLKNTPQLYGKLYKLAESGESITDVTKTASRILSSRLCRLISTFMPSVVVCTHSLPVQMLSSLKQKGKIHLPVIAIVTDYVNHLFWKLDHVDAFVVAHEYIKHDMVRMGIPACRIYPFGIPVARSFFESKCKKTLKQELQLDEGKPTVMIMGGSLGFGEIRKVFESLLNCSRELQIIAVTGFNEKLKKQLEGLLSHTHRSVRILSYTERVADLMEVSDFIITKPGGMTVSEALAKKLPIFIISPIPGQEEKNARFLINSGAAARIMPDDNIDSLLCQVLDNPLRIRHMKEMAGYLSRPNACEDIAKLIEKLSAEHHPDKKTLPVRSCIHCGNDITRTDLNFRNLN